MSATLPNLEEMLSQLVSHASVSSTQSQLDMSNSEVIAELANWLDDLGFEVQTQITDERRKKSNLIATLGPREKGLIFSGHTDTVPFDESFWLSDPLSVHRTDQGYRGLGTTDMKGFFAVLLEVLRDLPLHHLKSSLTLIATADEESSFGGARRLDELELVKDACVVIGEPTDLEPVHLHKGIMMESILVEGVAGHSSDPSLGINALEVMRDVLDQLLAFRTELQQRYHHPGLSVPVPTLNPGCIHGGDNPNRICSRCEFQFDLRPVPGMDTGELQIQIDELVSQIAQRWDTKIHRRSLLEPVAPFEQQTDTAFVKTVEKLCGPAKGVAFATEAPFYQKLGLQTLVLGPGSIDHAHQANEYIPHQQIEQGCHLYQQIIKQYCF